MAHGNDVALDCWRAATTLAEKCGVLHPDIAHFLSQLSGDWRVEIPDDLTEMPALYSTETWRVLEYEYKVSVRSNSTTALLLMLIKDHILDNELMTA